MKTWMAMGCLLLLLMMAAAVQAEGPVLILDLPEEATMVENVEFEDGDFIQSYQLAEGVNVQLLRYASFDMTLMDLAEGEWMGYLSAEDLDLIEMDGYPAEAMRLQYRAEDEKLIDVYMVRVDADGQTLIFELVMPDDASDRYEKQVDDWLKNMRVSGAETEEVG